MAFGVANLHVSRVSIRVRVVAVRPAALDPVVAVSVEVRSRVAGRAGVGLIIALVAGRLTGDTPAFVGIERPGLALLRPVAEQTVVALLVGLAQLTIGVSVGVGVSIAIPTATRRRSSEPDTLPAIQ